MGDGDRDEAVENDKGGPVWEMMLDSKSIHTRSLSNRSCRCAATSGLQSGLKQKGYIKSTGRQLSVVSTRLCPAASFNGS